MLEAAHSVCVRPSPRRWTRTAPKLNGGTVARRCCVFRPGALVASVASRCRGGCSGTPAASLSESGEAKQFPEQVGRQIIPIFPIGMVALPASKVPLQIFEARYRILFSTLLAGQEGIDEGLVQEDSEMKGMGRIGICLSDDKGGMCSVGTLMRIEEHRVLDDGRMVVVLEGLQRFKVTKVMQKRPVLICEADMLPCDEDESSETVELADNVRQLFRDVIQLGRKMMKPGAASEIPSPVSALSPCMLSFWLASYFPDSQAQQQQILEMDTTHERLLRLSTLLGDSVRYMSAATALQTALGGGSTAAAGGSDAGDTSGGPGGGPDSKN